MCIRDSVRSGALNGGVAGHTLAAGAHVEVGAEMCIRDRNQGIARAQSKYVVLFNNDAFAEPQWLAELLRTADAEDVYKRQALCSSLADIGLTPRCGWRLPGSSGLR